MKWRDLIIGFISALLVTVFGGALVYYLTKEPPKEKALEKLIYSTEQTATFNAKKMKFVLFTVRLGNIGNLPARNVDVAIEFQRNTEIIDKSVSLSSGPVGKHQITQEDSSSLSIRFPCLTPSEKATISFMIDKVPSKQPIIGVKSENSVGTKGSFKEPQKIDKKDRLNRVISDLIPMILVVALAMVFYLRKLAKRTVMRYGRDLNNTAFLLLHQGLLKESRALMEKDISEHGAHSHLLSNYALSLALDGDFKYLENRLRAAEFIASSKHDRAVVKFNRGLIAIIQEDLNKGIAFITEAVQLSPKEIIKYCKYSNIVSGLAKKHTEFEKNVKDILKK